MSRNGDSNDLAFAQANQAGRLVIKAALGEDIRCIPIHNEDITYDELVLMMQRVFRGKVNTGDEVLIKYKDEDGDLVTIFDSSDLTYAIHCSKTLRLTLFVNSQPKQLTSEEARNMRRELQDIRNRINQLLDGLDAVPVAAADIDAAAISADAKQGSASGPSAASSGSGREFDPLTASQKAGRDMRPPSTGSVDTGAQNVSSGSVPDGTDGVVSSSQQRPPSQPQQPHPAGGYRQPQQQGYMQPGIQAGYSTEPQRDQQALQPVRAGYPAPRPGYGPPQPSPVSSGYDPRRAAPGVHQPGSGSPSPQHQMYGQPPPGPPGAAAFGPPVPQGQAMPGQLGQTGGYPPPTASGYTGQPLPQQQQQYAQQQQQQQPPHGAFAPPQPSANVGGQPNPYARGGVYGQYPQPHGQYPPAQ